MSTEKRKVQPGWSWSCAVSTATEGTDGHNPLECAWLSPRVPLETFEPVIIPEMLREETEELCGRIARNGRTGERIGGGFPREWYTR